MNSNFILDISLIPDGIPSEIDQQELYECPCKFSSFPSYHIKANFNLPSSI